MEAAGERYQRMGLEGLEAAKLWLESTTRFAVQWTSWGKAGALPYVSVPQITGTAESFDLAGQHLEPGMEPRAEFYAEVKRYSAQRDQLDQYRKYLTRCYSAVLAWKAGGVPKQPEFLWITWHPFGATDNYRKLTSAEMIAEACQRHPERVPENKYDDAAANELAEHLWFLLVSPRLDDMMMSMDFLGIIRKHVTTNGEGNL